MEFDFRGFARRTLNYLCASAAVGVPLAASLPEAASAPTMAELLAAAPPSDWRRPDPQNTLYLDLSSGRVVIELAAQFAPRHVANIKTLARAHYYDGLGVIRVQDDYVSQWGDPSGRRPLPPHLFSADPEFDAPLMAGTPFTRLPDGDVYAPVVGFAAGFPVARSQALGRSWLAHCYGMVGIGRDLDAHSGSGAELYVVIGHAPRHLDRNVTLVGRVLKGVELLSSLPRGSEPMGFYGTGQTPMLVKNLQVAADLPIAERVPLEVLRTESKTFTAVIEARRNRTEDWFKVPAGKIDLCNVPLPVRDSAAP